MEAAAQPPKTGGEGAGKDEDLSMEEILQSIRRIIADDDAPKDGAKAAEESGVHGSDVLELTEMVEDDGSVVSLNEQAAPAPVIAKPAESAKVAELPSADVLSRIDQALAADKPAAVPPAPKPEPEKPAPVAAEKPPAPPVAAPPIEAPKPAAAKPALDSLLSAQAAAAAVTSLNKLKEEEPLPVVTTPSPAFRSGATVEDMVADMLKPMMKEWLDANLPTIVERIVEREVKRLTRP